MLKIEAKDLRVGNYITRESDTSFVCHVNFGIIKDLELELPNDYVGIPITEEWLLKFGFTKSTNDNSKIIDWIFWNEIGISRFILKILYENDGYVSRGVEYRIRYIHQLQNLFFALTAEELTLKQK